MVNLAYDSLSDEKLSRGTLSKDVLSSSIVSFPDLCLETEALHSYSQILNHICKCGVEAHVTAQRPTAKIPVESHVTHKAETFPYIRVHVCAHDVKHCTGIISRCIIFAVD